MFNFVASRISSRRVHEQHDLYWTLGRQMLSSEKQFIGHYDDDDDDDDDDDIHA